MPRLAWYCIPLSTGNRTDYKYLYQVDHQVDHTVLSLVRRMPSRPDRLAFVPKVLSDFRVLRGIIPSLVTASSRAKYPINPTIASYLDLQKGFISVLILLKTVLNHHTYLPYSKEHTVKKEKKEKKRGKKKEKKTIMTCTEKPVIVIIPGAWHVPAHYAHLALKLNSAGYTVDCIESSATCDEKDKATPTNTWKADISIIRNAITGHTRAGRDVVVVMHSFGGMAGSEAAYGLGRNDFESEAEGAVIKLIYMASFLVQENQGRADFENDEPWPMIANVDDPKVCLSIFIGPLVTSGKTNEKQTESQILHPNHTKTLLLPRRPGPNDPTCPRQYRKLPHGPRNEQTCPSRLASNPHRIYRLSRRQGHSPSSAGPHD
jgi:hypothetical protein